MYPPIEAIFFTIFVVALVVNAIITHYRISDKNEDLQGEIKKVAEDLKKEANYSSHTKQQAWDNDTEIRALYDHFGLKYKRSGCVIDAPAEKKKEGAHLPTPDYR
jgi:membrane protein insertase Oxa1/YidC/SpoIIIJ